MDSARITRELADIRRDITAHITVVVLDENIHHLRGTIHGPDSTPYDGGVFEIDINIPDDYPFSPPKMKFITKIWHPNISSVTGAICLDILKDAWSPALTVKTALLSLQALLCAAEPTDPQDAVVARMYLTNREEFNQTARNWTTLHARPREAIEQDAIRSLVDMGIDETSARNALQACNWELQAAINRLFG